MSLQAIVGGLVREDSADWEGVLTYLYRHIPMAHVTQIARDWQRRCGSEKLEGKEDSDQGGSLLL